MRKIGIITFLHNDNYGSSLQAWALQQTVKNLGYSAEHIDYRPNLSEKIRNMLSSKNSPKLLLESLKKHSVKNEQPAAQKKTEMINEFYDKYLEMSVPCTTLIDLQKIAANYDALMCGSDQVWSPVWFNPVYYLGFGQSDQPRIAYACSLGVKSIESKDKANKIQKYLQSFDAISVREHEGQMALEQLDSHLHIDVMPDPVFLRTAEEWLCMAKTTEKPQHYMLCYLLGARKDYWACIQRIAQKNNLHPVVFPVTMESFQWDMIKCDDFSPQSWLGWIANADLVCTDSFHGTAFASIFQKECIVLRRDNDHDKDSKNSRIDHLARILGNAEASHFVPSGDMQIRIDKQRQLGIEWLANALTETTIKHEN